MRYFDSTSTFRIPFFQIRYRILGWGSAHGCHVARPRGFTIPPRGSRRGRTPRRRRPLRAREISIERFAETPRGWSWRVSANVSASGAEKLNSLPFFPVSLAPSRCLSLLPVDSPLLSLPFYLPRSLFAADLPLCFSPFLHPRWNPVASLWMVALPRVFN